MNINVPLDHVTFLNSLLQCISIYRNAACWWKNVRGHSFSGCGPHQMNVDVFTCQEWMYRRRSAGDVLHSAHPQCAAVCHSATCSAQSLTERAAAEGLSFEQRRTPSGAVVAFLRSWPHLQISWRTYLLTVRRSGSALVSISEVNLRLARLVLRWVTVSGFSSRCHRHYFGMQPATKASTNPESINEGQLRLGKKSQVWFIPLADEPRDVQVKLWDFLRTRAIPERLRGVFTMRRYTNLRLPLPLP